MLFRSDFYYQLIGYTKPEYEARFHNHCDEYFMDNLETWDILCNKIDNMSAAGEDSFETYLPLKLPDGSSRWVKLVDFFTNEYQDGIQMAYTTMIDVTELLQAQQDKSVAYEHVPGFIVKYRVLPDRLIMIDASSRIKDFFDVDLEHLADTDFMGVLQPESRQVIEAPRFSAAAVFAICIRETIPSCILAPPEHANKITGRFSFVAALLLTVRAAGKSADNEKEAAPYEEDTPWEPELE